MTETEFAESFARQLRQQIASQHGQGVAALLGAEWFDSMGAAVAEFAVAVTSSARREALEEVGEAARAMCGTQPLSLISDPYTRGCVDTANAITERVRALAGESGVEGEG